MAVKTTETPENIPATKQKVRIYIPKTSKNDTERYFCVNGRRVLIQTEKEVWVDPEIAEVWENSKAANAEAERYIEQNAKD